MSMCKYASKARAASHWLFLCLFYSQEARKGTLRYWAGARKRAMVGITTKEVEALGRVPVCWLKQKIICCTCDKYFTS